MQNKRKEISSLWYFILVSSLTNLTFLLAGVVLLALFSFQLSSFAAKIIIFLLLWKGGIVGFVTWFSHKKIYNKEFLVKFIGIYLGRFFGIFVGGFLGVRISNVLNQSDLIGFILGALIFYFAGRWLGSKVSTMIGEQLDKVFYIPELSPSERLSDVRSTNRFSFISFILYSAVVPLSLVVIGLLINYYDIPIGYLTELLPISRIVVIVLSIFSLCFPWLMRNRWLSRFQSKTSSSESLIYWTGLVFCVVPVIYGFILFIAMGASVFELCVYAVASSVAAILWSMNNGVFKEQNAG
jgi:hypothetical protein